MEGLVEASVMVIAAALPATPAWKLERVSGQSSIMAHRVISGAAVQRLQAIRERGQSIRKLRPSRTLAHRT